MLQCTVKNISHALRGLIIGPRKLLEYPNNGEKGKKKSFESFINMVEGHVLLVTTR